MALTYARRKGFSFVELLLIIAMMTVVIALLVPALQKVRSASTRTECENNLREIGVAFTRFHDAHKHLPPGGRNAPGLDPATGKCYTRALAREDFSWCYQILPHLQKNAKAMATEDATLLTTPIAAFHCPSRRRVQLYHGDSICDYAGNGGTNNMDGTILETGRSKPLRLRAITDGAANTLLLGERRVNIALLDGARDAQDGESCFNPGYDGNVIRWATRDRECMGIKRDLADETADPTAPHNYFGSSHEGSMNALLADGSVRSMSYGIAPDIFRRICVREDVRSRHAD